MHPLMVLIRPLPVLIRGTDGGALASATGAKAWIGGAYRVEYSIRQYVKNQGKEKEYKQLYLNFPTREAPL